MQSLKCRARFDASLQDKDSVEKLKYQVQDEEDRPKESTWKVQSIALPACRTSKTYLDNDAAQDVFAQQLKPWRESSADTSESV